MAGLSPATVSNLVADLVTEGVIAEVGLEDSNGGRPRGLLQVNPEYGYVIGVDVGETAFLVELFDLGLRMRARHRSATDMAVLDPADAVDPRGGGIRSVIAAGRRRRAARYSASASPCPAWSSTREHAVVHGQSVGWDAVPVETHAARHGRPAGAGRQRREDARPGREVVRRRPRHRQRDHRAARHWASAPASSATARSTGARRAARGSGATPRSSSAAAAAGAARTAAWRPTSARPRSRPGTPSSADGSHRPARRTWKARSRHHRLQRARPGRARCSTRS